LEHSDGVDARIERLAGDWNGKHATLSGRLDQHHNEISDLDDRLKSTEEFQVTIARKWDYSEGVRVTEEKHQQERHAQNIEAINRMGTRIALGGLIVAFLMLIFTVAASIISYEAGLHKSADVPHPIPTRASFAVRE
jgi:hypothetical protein